MTTTQPCQDWVSTAEDQDTIEAVATQDPDALRRLYDRYHAILRSVLLRVLPDHSEADDLLHEVFMQIWREAGRYSPVKGKPLAWMITLTRRRAIDRIRKRQAYQRARDRMAADAGQHSGGSGTDSALENDDLRQFLRTHLARLPPYQREAVELAYFNGLSQREIAAATRTPLGTIKTRLELGLRKLHESIRELRGPI